MTLAFVAASSCRPDFGERESLVTRERVLAVRGEPPEAKPGESVHYSILVASPQGNVPTPSAEWAVCRVPKLQTENGVASAACLGSGSIPVAVGSSTVDTPVPSDACQLFGPDVTSADLRPRDPDVTGGYFQPLRVLLDRTGGADESPTPTFGLERITCHLANAPADVASDFGARYEANRNPELLPLTATLRGASLPLDAIPRGTTVTLRAAWSDGSAERYVVYDLATRTLVDHRESMRASWFTTTGSFANDRTGRGEEEPESFTENPWTTPDAATVAHVFVVLRDARGGVSFASYDIDVR
jgi:hypothetical protein